MRKTLLIATTNPGKLREVRTVLADLPLGLITLADHPDIPAPVEDADSFEEIARRKALHYARAVAGWALADDSGLEVDALGGKPGIHSSRYAGAQSTDGDNNRKLIDELKGVPVSRRTARFRCCVALASGGEVVATASGTIEGRILTEPRGDNGFGYDPYFWIEERGMSVAEMTPEEKNQISHRGRALRAIRPAIERWVVDPDRLA